MSKMLNALKWGISRGKESQNFLGAKWIGSFLDRVNERNRRIWALRILVFWLLKMDSNLIIELPRVSLFGYLGEKLSRTVLW